MLLNILLMQYMALLVDNDLILKSWLC